MVAVVGKRIVPVKRKLGEGMMRVGNNREKHGDLRGRWFYGGD